MTGGYFDFDRDGHLFRLVGRKPHQRRRRAGIVGFNLEGAFFDVKFNRIAKVTDTAPSAERSEAQPASKKCRKKHEKNARM